jgi:ribosomal protein S18 acetylase RimI-like enzyme
MISLEPITPQNAMIFKEIRLRALQDAPSAFSSTYAKESQLSDAAWIERASQWSGERSVAYLAMDSDIPCGIGAAFLDQEDGTRAQLVSMWVAPSHRRLGIASSLVKAIMDRARLQGVRTLRLLVTSNNAAAIKLYERLGFSMTGRTTPYANDPSLDDCEMSRPIAQR